MCGREVMISAAWEVGRLLALVLPSRRRRRWSGLLIPFSFGRLRGLRVKQLMPALTWKNTDLGLRTRLRIYVYCVRF